VIYAVILFSSSTPIHAHIIHFEVVRIRSVLRVVAAELKTETTGARGEDHIETRFGVNDFV
jgi:hypothetical protein